MQYLVVADLHYALKQYDWLLDVAEDFDAICLAGDLLETASIVPVEAQVVVVRAYLRKLAAIAPLIVCSGNHDLTQTDANGEKVAQWLQDLPFGRIMADGACGDCGPALVSVLPWWDGPVAQAQISAQLERDAARRTGDWIWVYHAPPADSPVSWGGTRHFGDTVLPEWIERYRPDMVFSGHVHQAPFISDGSWVDRIGESWVFNMGQQPGPAPAHIIVNTAAREAVWFSLEGQQHIVLSGPDARPEPMRALPDWLKAVDPLAG